MMLSGSGGYTRDGQQTAHGTFMLVFAADDERVRIGGNVCCWCGTRQDAPISEVCPRRRWASLERHDDRLEFSYYGDGEHGWMPRRASALYAIARRVRLSQLGHFMMGSVRIVDSIITVSGAYGHDGLPCSMNELTPRARAKLTRVPDELAVKFWNSGGHNSSGSEGLAMAAWGRKTLGTP